MQLTIASEADMMALGQRLAQACADGGCTVFLRGELGAGKTTLARGFLRGMGHPGSVRSPTFTLVEPYEINGRQIFHFDLYRLADPEELEYLGVRDYFGGDAICLIEWPERGAGRLPDADLSITLRLANGGRSVELAGQTPSGVRILENLR
ncbi:MAG: hypothetical protein FD165_1142 [Gammaproteobacteria bacterium]|nr:MAG: hypothetical protein FD165_1142 [Gammaproteobacteria bacterium]TND07301.1 MAG: hypothetical protein FD120_39 [Gammaproteobacteria bacterium]